MINTQSQLAEPFLARARAGASWFMWIAGFSIISSLITWFVPKSNWAVYFGLNITQLVDGMASIAHARTAGLIGDVVFAAVWVFFGLQARMGKVWAFIVGMIFYAIDGLMMLPFGVWITAVVHAFVISRLYPGLTASRDYETLMKTNSVGHYGYAAPGDVYPPTPQPIEYAQQPGVFPQQPDDQPESYGQNIDNPSSEQ